MFEKDVLLGDGYRMAALWQPGPYEGSEFRQVCYLTPSENHKSIPRTKIC